MRVAYVGNFGPAHSTENEVRKALELLGHHVEPLQENDPASWERLLAVGPGEFDLVLWTRTWHLPDFDQLGALDACARAHVPTVGFHLDRWWGLNREPQIDVEPFFRCSVLYTADGGHDLEFAAAGVNHRWSPPAVSALECTPGRVDRRFVSDVAFVGSWRGYHEEWTHRDDLVAWLRATFRARVRFWPARGGAAIRGRALRDLYASARVLVGDSCLVPPCSRYWSDRIPETLGRGGFLLHPYVDGIDDEYVDGVHLRLWQAGDWDELRKLIDYYLVHDDERRTIAAAGRAHVLERHTYTHRLARVLDEVVG